MHLRDYELAMDLLEEMVDMGMPANAEGYATGIRTCARCSKSDEAVYLYANQLHTTVIPSKVRPIPSAHDGGLSSALVKRPLAVKSYDSVFRSIRWGSCVSGTVLRLGEIGAVRRVPCLTRPSHSSVPHLWKG